MQWQNCLLPSIGTTWSLASPQGYRPLQGTAGHCRPPGFCLCHVDRKRDISGHLERSDITQRAHYAESLPQPTDLSEAPVELGMKKDTSEVTICPLIGLSCTIWPADAQESKKSESGKLVTSPSVDLRLSVTWGEAAVSSLPGGTSPTTSRKWTPPQVQPSPGSTADLSPGVPGEAPLLSREKSGPSSGYRVGREGSGVNSMGRGVALGTVWDDGGK